MSCVGCNDGCFDESVQLAQGPTGNAGTNGSNGLYGGWSLKWKFDDNTGSGTGSNEVRLNSVDPQTANVIYVNDDAFGTGAADVFLSSVTSAPYGRIKIFKEYDSTVFWLATITAADDTAVPAEVKFTVTDVVTNGSFTDGDDVVLTLAPAGATGATGTGTPGTDGVAVLDYRTADGGPFGGGVLYYPGIVQAAISNLAVVQDAFANNLQTTIPENTLQNVGDFLRIKLVVAVQSPEVPKSSFGAMQFSVWWDTTLIGSFNVGSLAKYAIGSQGSEAIIDVAMVDNTLITTGNVQTSTNIKWFDESEIGLAANLVSGNLYDKVFKGVTINETLSNPHTIYVKAINPEANTSNSNIIDLEESAGRFSNDAGYVLAYEVIKYKKQV